ncbi:MAG TPA: FAD-dependent oxidoreductase [Limnobacter sp.]|nr:FAD-dependent oxidoreductase [Limnobacter sp.]
MAKRIAVIGAGMSGLACARALTGLGHDVIVFEKSRGPGGRMPTRWLDRDAQPPLGFDHGTQYFQASAPSFLQLLEEAQQAGAVALWSGHVVDLSYGVMQPHSPGAKRWVGTPGMASLAKFMSQGLNIHLQSRVAGVMRQGALYQLTLHLGDGAVRVESGFDAVVCAIPAEQVVQLFVDFHPTLAGLAKTVQSTVTWAVMLTPREPLKVPYDGAFVVDSPLGWICRDSSKPGRAAGERWLLQATADWSQLHRDGAADEVATLLLDVFSNVTGQLVEPIQITAHRWLYSLPTNPLGLQYYLDEDHLIGACGDWLSASRVEDAFLSGHALGERLHLALDAAMVD